MGGNPLKDVTQSVTYGSATAPGALPNQATSVTTSSPARGTATSTPNYKDTSHVGTGVNAGAVTSRDSSSTGSLVSGVKSTSGGDMCLADPAGNTADGTAQIIYTCGYGGQTYTVGTDGTVKISGKCLDTASDTPVNNTLVVINTCSASRPTQMWRATASGSLVNVQSKLCLADPAANPANSTKQILYTCNKGGQTYTTPAAGTSLTAGQTQTVAYDEEGRTKTVVTGDGTTPKTTSYLYDAEGNLLVERDSGSTILYLFDGTEQLTLKTSSGAVTGQRYYRNPDGTTIVRGSDGKLTYHPTDPQGTSQLEVDGSSMAVTRRAFDPYGAPRGAAPASWTDNHGYLDRPTDPGSGLDLLGARDYDPTLGRFLSVDPVFEAGDPNQMGGYAYAGDDPVNGSDPSGLMLATVTGGGGDDGTHPGKVSSSVDEAAGAADSVLGGITSFFNHGLPKGARLPEHPVADALNVDKNSIYYKTGEIAGGVASLMVDGGAIADAARAQRAAEELPSVVNDAERMATRLFGDTPADSAPTPEAEPDLAPPGNPDGSAPAQAAKPTSPKSGTAKKPVADDTPPSAEAADDSHSSGGTHEQPSGKCSFSPDTPVLLGDGKTKPIGDVSVGDKVEAADPATGKDAGSRDVTATWVNYDNDLVDVTVKGSDGKPSTLHTTSKHPFWDDTAHAWVPAGKLKPGHALNTNKNTHVTVVAIHATPGAANRWNLTVAQLHTYYVLAGSIPVLVHNTNGNCEIGDGYLYRGLAKGHRNYDAATDGRAVPNGGHSNIRWHVGGNQTDSIFTSWTHDLERATEGAQYLNDEWVGEGVILRTREVSIDPEIGPSRNIQIHGSEYDMDEDEHLIVGEYRASEISYDFGETWESVAR